MSVRSLRAAPRTWFRGAVAVVLGASATATIAFAAVLGAPLGDDLRAGGSQHVAAEQGAAFAPAADSISAWRSKAAPRSSLRTPLTGSKGA